MTEIFAQLDPKGVDLIRGIFVGHIVDDAARFHGKIPRLREEAPKVLSGSLAERDKIYERTDGARCILNIQVNVMYFGFSFFILSFWYAMKFSVGRVCGDGGWW